VPNPKCKEAPGCGEWKRPSKPVRQSPLLTSLPHWRALLAALPATTAVHPSQPSRLMTF
jgi:hypothetical protein